MGSYGVLSLLPMVVGIALVLVTKRTAASLLAGTVVGAVILHGIDFPKHWLDVVYGTLSSQLWIWVMLTVGIFGSLVALFERSGGSRGFTAAASRLCGSERRSLLMTWLLSIVVFVDDYLAILSVGSAMKGITDRYRVPREMVAFLICTVSASACVSIPISSWGMFITSQLAATGICDASEGIYTYLRLIPLLFYPLLMVICGGLYAARVLPVFGPMKRAYLREQSRELVCEAGAEQEAEGPKPHAWNLLLPMAVIVAVTLAAGDAMYGVFGGLIACGVLYIPQKLMTGREFLGDLCHFHGGSGPNDPVYGWGYAAMCRGDRLRDRGQLQRLFLCLPGYAGGFGQWDHQRRLRKNVPALAGGAVCTQFGGISGGGVFDTVSLRLIFTLDNPCHRDAIIMT